MTKAEALAATKLLAAVELWAMSLQTQPPDYLYEDLHISMEALDSFILTPPQEKYIHGTPLLDAMTKEKNI
jgi:hypothetical protein